MSEQVDTRISPTLHPSISDEIADYDDDTRPLLGATETAVSEAFAALKSIHDAKAAVATNPTLNEWAQLVAVDNHATKLMDKVYAKWSRTTDVLNNNIAAMEKDLYAPVESKASHTLATEVRQHFARLDNDGQRMSALRKAIETGDETTATAVLGAPGYLSGLSDELHAEYLKDWHNAQRPVEAKKVRAMRAATPTCSMSDTSCSRSRTATLSVSSRRLRRADAAKRSSSGFGPPHRCVSACARPTNPSPFRSDLSDLLISDCSIKGKRT